MLKFHKVANGRFEEIIIFNEKNYLKKHIFGPKAKNNDKWMGIVSYIEMICHK